MAYDRQFLSLQYGFTIVGTDEVAFTGINYSTVTGWTGAATALAELTSAAVGPDLIDAMNNLMDTTQLQHATYSALNFVKVAAVGTDGRYIDVGTNPYIYEDSTPLVGTSENILPQSTVVASMRSGFTTGPANYGRMYLPHTKIAQGAGDAIGDPTSANNIALAVREFVNTTTTIVDGAASATLFPVILSQVGSGAGKGVTQVAVGCVTDTQRRRRNNLDENYQFQAL